MEEQLKQLYELYLRKSLLSKETTFEMFSQADDKLKQGLYDLGVKNKLLSSETDFNTFSSAWGVKKKDVSEPISPTDPTGSVSAPTDPAISSGSSNPEPNTPIDPTGGEAPNQFAQQPVVEEEGVAITNAEPEEEPQDPITDIYGNGKFTIKNSQEKDTYLEDIVGKNSVTDFISDIYRSGKAGFIQGNTADESLELLYDGSDATSEDIQDFLAAQRRLAANGQTDEMANFNNIYDNADNKAIGFMEGMAKNPSVIFQLLAETVTQMFNTASISAAGGVLGTAAAGGAAVGVGFGGVGAIPGAGAAVFNPVTLRIAFGAAGAALETGLSFSQFLQKELDTRNLEMNEANIKEVLNDPEALSRIRLNSLGRGGIIGTIDALAAGGGSLLVTGAAKAGSTVARRKLLAAGADAIGGGVGETAAILATEGVDALDVREIGFETIGGIGKTPISYAITKYRGKMPTYTIKGKPVESGLMAEAVFDSSDEAFLGMNIDIQNDPDLKNEYSKRKMKLLAGQDIKLKLQEAGVSETNIDALVDLELEKNKFTGNDTEAGKEKLREIKNKIAELSGYTEETQITKDEVDAENEQIETEYEDEVDALDAKYFKISPLNRILRAAGKEYSLAQRNMNMTDEESAEKDAAYEAAEDKKLERLSELKKQTDAGADNVLSSAEISKREQYLLDLEYEKLVRESNKKDQKIKENIELTEEEEKIALDNNQAEFKQKVEEINKKSDAIQKSSTEKVDAQESSEDSPKVGAGDGIPSVTPNEKGKKNANKNQSPKEVADDEKEKKLVQNQKTYNIVRDKSGEVVSINDKKGKPLKGKRLATAEKNIINNDLNVDEGKKAETNPGMTVDQYNEDIADNSDNIREIAEAIEQEELSSKEKKNQSEQDQENEDNRTYRGTISEADFARYNDKNNLPKDKRSRIWKFISKPVKDALGRETNVGGEGFDNMIENIAEESGQTIEAVMEEYFNYILSEKEPKRNPRAILNALKDRFKAVTGVRPTKANVKAAVNKKLESAQQQVAQEEAAEKDKQAQEVDLKNEIQENVFKRLTEMDFSKGFKSIRDYLKTLREDDKISFKQMSLIMDQIEKTSFDNEKSRDKTVNYIKKVLSDISVRSEQRTLRKLAAQAKKNIKKLIGRMLAGKEDGSTISLEAQLSSLVNIDPSVIPNKVYNTYKSIIEQIGQRTKAYDKKNITEASVMAEKVQEVLAAVAEQEQTLPQLTQAFNNFEGKVLYKNGKVNYLDTIAKMLKDNVITEEDADLMKKYKKDINSKPDAQPKTAEEIAEEKKVLIDEIKNIKVDSDRTAPASPKSFPSEISRRAAYAFNKLIKDISAIEGLSVDDLKLIIRTVDSLNKGYMPVSLISNLSSKLNANKNVAKVADKFSKFDFLSVSKLYAKVTSLFNKKENFALSAIKRNTLYGIDQLLNNFGSMDLYNSLFKPMAKAYSSFKTANQQDGNLREKASKLLNRQFLKNSNKIIESKYKQMLYRIQLEYISNPELRDKKLQSADKWLAESIRDYEKGTENPDKRVVNLLKKLQEKFVEDGALNNDKLFNSFSKREKQALEILQSIDTKNQEKAQFAAERRGEGFIPRINYVHIAVKPSISDKISDPNKDIIENFISSSSVNRPSTKSKAGIERTGAVSPIYWDSFQASARGSKFTNLDFYMTDGVKESNFAVNKLIRTINEQNPDGVPENTQRILTALADAQKEVINNVLVDSYTDNTFAGEIISKIQKLGYYTMLAGAKRFSAEVIANMQFAITHPVLFAQGIGMANRLPNATSLSTIMKNLGSSVTTRVTGSGLNSSKIDTGLLNTRETAGDTLSSKMGNKIMQIWRLSGKNWSKGVSIIAESIISAPDKMITQPFWKATFANAYKKETGKKPDWTKLEANDEVYITENKEALDAATDAADRWTNTVGSSDNPFMRSIKDANPKTPLGVIFANYNSFMLNFLKQEFISARQGTYELMGKGDRTKAQGAQLLAAVSLRMTAYTFVLKVMNDALFEALDLDDEDDEPKDIELQLAQSLATSFTGLLLGRNFGNLNRAAQAYFIEMGNEGFGQDLRDGEYDRYRDAIQFDALGNAGDGDKFLTSFLGAYTPLVNSMLFGLKKYTEKDFKEGGSARERQIREKEERVPLELLGNLGMVPLYKDVKSLLIKDIYKGMGKKEKTYNKQELLKLKRKNPTVYRNYIFKKKTEKYDRDLIKYNTYRANTRKWKKENPNTKRPIKPRRPRR